ncbi:cation transporter, partial [Achromobacter xylosoxidans]
MSSASTRHPEHSATAGACCGGHAPAAKRAGPGCGHDHGQAQGHDHDHGQGHDHRHDHDHGQDHDHGHGHAHDHGHGHAATACCTHDAGAIRMSGDAAALQAGPGQLLARLRIGQMDCPTEETLIRKKLDGVAGVHALDFNLMQRILTVVHAEGALDRITAAIKSLGMTPEPLADDAPRTPAPAAA